MNDLDRFPFDIHKLSYRLETGERTNPFDRYVDNNTGNFWRFLATPSEQPENIHALARPIEGEDNGHKKSKG